MARRSSRFDCPLSDPQADIPPGFGQRPFVAEPGHWGSGMSNDGWGSFAVIMSHPGNRLLSGESSRLMSALGSLQTSLITMLAD